MTLTTMDIITSIDAYLPSGPSHIVVDERMSDGFLRIFSGDRSITHKFIKSKIFSNKFQKECSSTCVRDRSRFTFSRITSNISSKKLFENFEEIINNCSHCNNKYTITFEVVENIVSDNIRKIKGSLNSKIYCKDNKKEYLLSMHGELLNKNDVALGKYLKAHERFDIVCTYDKPKCSPRTLVTELSPKQACQEDGAIMLKRT